jgi:hypothetical protein
MARTATPRLLPVPHRARTVRGLGVMAATLCGLGFVAAPVRAQSCSCERVFLGTSPALPGSTARLILKEDFRNEKVFSWVSSDPILGPLDSNGFVSVPDNKWIVSGQSPARVVFTGAADGALFYANVLLDPYFRAVVDVVKQSKRVRYVLAAICIAAGTTEWVGFDPGDGKTNYEKGTNPAPLGGGDRLFAERNQPEGRANDQLHHRILIKATLSAAPPAGQLMTVFFKVFDTDHYSDDASFDPNGAKDPDDNVKAGGALDIGAKLMTSDFAAETEQAVLTGDGVTKEVIIGLQLTALQPGNTYKVVAHCSQEYVDGVKFAADGKTLKVGKPDGPDVPPQFQTDLVTIWRTLHVEQDSMAAPDFTKGPAPSRIESGNITAIDGMTMTTNVAIHAPGGRNQFQGGHVIQLLREDDTVIAGGPFAVRANTTGPNSTVTLANPVPAGAAKFKSLQDDDPLGGVLAEDMVVDTRLWASRYEPAMVRVDLTKNDLSPADGEDVNQATVTFVPNVGTAGTEADFKTKINEIVKANKQGASTAGFWVIYQLGAYQGPVDKDSDPNGEEALLGISSIFSLPGDDPQAGTIVFRETVRDVRVAQPAVVKISEANLWAATSVHESGHQFGLVDGLIDGKLMDSPTMAAADSDVKVAALIFNGSGLRKIIIKGFPGK